MFLIAIDRYTSNAAIPAAVECAVGTLLGSVSTGVAMLAVAFLGLGMLFGHLDWRTVTRVVLGLFILFGATGIARELASLAQGGEDAETRQFANHSNPDQPSVYDNEAIADPYAGSSVPH